MVFNIWRVNGICEPLPYKPQMIQPAQRAEPAPFAPNPTLASPNGNRRPQDQLGEQFEENQKHSSAPPALNLPILLAGQVMSFPVISVNVNTPLKQVWQIITKKGYRNLPVVDAQGCLVGMISDRALMKEAVNLALHKNKHVKNLIDIMDYQAISTGLDTSLDLMARVFIDQGIRCMPICHQDGTIAGIITRNDILRALFPKKSQSRSAN